MLYVDIDAQHCTGVEEAFYTSSCVTTVSFHEAGTTTSFPGTGNVDDIGHEGGKGYAVNVPLHAGATDDTFRHVFPTILSHVLKHFRPQVVVYKSGANSLAGDRLENMNLSLEGHGDCLAFLCATNLPMLVLGGSGSTLRNVTRCWTYETALVLGLSLDDRIIPRHEYREHYAPQYRLLESSPVCVHDANTRTYLDTTLSTIVHNIQTFMRAEPLKP